MKKKIWLNKKVIFVHLYIFCTILKLHFMRQIIYCIIHRRLYSLLILSLCSYFPFSEMGHRKNTQKEFTK